MSGHSFVNKRIYIYGVTDIHLWQLFLRIRYLFNSIFSGIVWIDKLRNEGTCFPNNGCHGNTKKAIFPLPCQRLLRGKKAS